MPNTKIPALPEPTAYRVAARYWSKLTSIPFSLRDEAEPLFTADQMLAFREAGRVAGLEEAAQAADRCGQSVGSSDGWGTCIPGTSGEAAIAIRKLLKAKP